MERKANGEEQQLIDLLKVNLSKFACFGINTLINEVVAPQSSRVHIIDVHDVHPVTPVAHNVRQRSAYTGIRVSSSEHADSGIRVSSQNDNINRSYVRDYLESSGCAFDNIVDHRAGDSESCCVVCEDNASIIMLMPCNHIAFCKQCSKLLSECPLCKKHIDHKIRVYPS